MTSIDAKLEALVGHPPPWSEAPPLAPASEDPAIEALFRALERSVSDAPAAGRALDALRSAPHGDVAAGAARWLRALTVQPQVYHPRIAEIEADESLRRRFAERMTPVIFAGRRRLRLVELLLALLPPVLPGAEIDGLSALLASSTPEAGELLVSALLARVPPQGHADRAVVLGHLIERCPSVATRAVALVMRDGAAAIPAIAAALERASDAEKVGIATRVCRAKDAVDFDAAPEWVDMIFARVQGLPIAMLEVCYRVFEARTPEPALRALACTTEEVYWSDLLDALKRLDDASAAPRLEALAAGLPEAPKGSKVKRSRGAVLSLAKTLRRKRKAPAHTVLGGVGTDGGPLLLVAADASASWGGVPADWDPDRGGSDYDRAWAASEAGLGALEIDGTRALAIPHQGATALRGAGGDLFVVLEGGDLDVEAAVGGKRGWRKTPLSVDAGAEGVALMDATVTGGTGGEGSLLVLPLPEGRYEVREYRAVGRVHVLTFARAGARQR